MNTADARLAQATEDARDALDEPTRPIVAKPRPDVRFLMLKPGVRLTPELKARLRVWWASLCRGPHNSLCKILSEGVELT